MITLMLEHGSISFMDFYQTRLSKGNYFSDLELFRLAENSLSALMFLQQVGMLSHFQPDMLFLTHNRTYKILHPVLFPLILGHNEPPPTDIPQSIFLFGYLLLSIALLEPALQPINSYNIEPSYLNSKIDTLNSTISSKITHLLTLTLQKDPSCRPSLQELYDYLLNNKQIGKRLINHKNDLKIQTSNLSQQQVSAGESKQIKVDDRAHISHNRVVHDEYVQENTDPTLRPSNNSIMNTQHLSRSSQKIHGRLDSHLQEMNNTRQSRMSGQENYQSDHIDNKMATNTTPQMQLSHNTKYKNMSDYQQSDIRVQEINSQQDIIDNVVFSYGRHDDEEYSYQDRHKAQAEIHKQSKTNTDQPQDNSKDNQYINADFINTNSRPTPSPAKQSLGHQSTPTCRQLNYDHPNQSSQPIVSSQKRPVAISFQQSSSKPPSLPAQSNTKQPMWSNTKQPALQQSNSSYQQPARMSFQHPVQLSASNISNSQTSYQPFGNTLFGKTQQSYNCEGRSQEQPDHHLEQQQHLQQQQQEIEQQQKIQQLEYQEQQQPINYQHVQPVLYHHPTPVEYIQYQPPPPITHPPRLPRESSLPKHQPQGMPIHGPVTHSTPRFIRTKSVYQPQHHSPLRPTQSLCQCAPSHSRALSFQQISAHHQIEQVRQCAHCKAQTITTVARHPQPREEDSPVDFYQIYRDNNYLQGETLAKPYHRAPDLCTHDTLPTHLAANPYLAKSNRPKKQSEGVHEYSQQKAKKQANVLNNPYALPTTQCSPSEPDGIGGIYSKTQKADKYLQGSGSTSHPAHSAHASQMQSMHPSQMQSVHPSHHYEEQNIVPAEQIQSNHTSRPVDINVNVHIQRDMEPEGEGDTVQDGEVIIERFSNGSYYKGQKRDKQRHGYGKFFYEDGGLYDGQWQHNQMHGQGSLYYQNGTLAYQGSWLADCFHGQGKLYNDQPMAMDTPFQGTDFGRVGQGWVSYDGAFKQDMKHGQGVVELTNGERVVGSFREDKLDGPGALYRTDGRVQQAHWKDNQLLSLE